MISIHHCNDVNDMQKGRAADLPDADSCLSKAPFPQRRCHSCDFKLETLLEQQMHTMHYTIMLCILIVLTWDRKGFWKYMAWASHVERRKSSEMKAGLQHVHTCVYS